MTKLHARPRLLACAACGLVALGAGTRPASSTSTALAATGSTLPVVAEHRYRLAAKIRPLLLFWIGRDNVGGARIQWRQGEEGARGIELLIGSDPQRAPRGINRWGYISEEVRGEAAEVVGVMKQSDEESLEEAKSRIANEAKEGYAFKAIRATVNGNEAVSTITTARAARDYTYRDLTPLLDLIDQHPVATRQRQMRLAAGTRPGFLSALTELMQRTIEAYRQSPKTPVPARSLDYVYNAKLYKLTLRSSSYRDRLRVRDRDYARVVESEFQVYAYDSKETEDFELTYGTEGPLAGIPVFMTYQPRWWFKAELVLDENERF